MADLERNTNFVSCVTNPLRTDLPFRSSSDTVACVAWRESCAIPRNLHKSGKCFRYSNTREGYGLLDVYRRSDERELKSPHVRAANVLIPKHDLYKINLRAMRAPRSAMRASLKKGDRMERAWGAASGETASTATVWRCTKPKRSAILLLRLS